MICGIQLLLKCYHLKLVLDFILQVTLTISMSQPPPVFIINSPLIKGIEHEKKNCLTGKILGNQTDPSEDTYHYISIQMPQRKYKSCYYSTIYIRSVK